MNGLPAETAKVLKDLIAQSEIHREEQMALLHSLIKRGESTKEALHLLGHIEDTLAAMRSRRSYLQVMEQRTQ